MTCTSLTTPSTGRTDLGPAELAFGAAQRLLVDGDLGVDLAALVERLLLELKRRLGRLGLGLAHRGEGLALLLARGGDAALDVDDLTLLFEEVGLRNDVLGGERRHHLDLVLREAQRALQAADRRRGFARHRAAPGRRSPATPATLLRSAE